MAYKIYRRGGYFYIVDTSDGRERDGLVKDVKVTRGSTTDDDFYIKGVNNWSNSTAINILDIQDVNGNNYSLSGFIDFYENNSTDINIQDSTSPLMIVKASKLIAETTITSAAVIDEYTIDVASTTSFLVGQYLTIYNANEDRVYFSNILSINVLEITLDTPIDFDFPIGSFVSIGDTNLNVNGSVTPQIFGVRNPTGIDIPLKFDITRLMFSCLTDNTVDLSKFGDIIGGITRGLVVRRVDGTQQNVFNIKTNAEMKNMMYDFDIETAQGAQQDGFNTRFTFGGQNKMGAVLRIGANEDLQVIVQDDLESLVSLTLIAEGSQVVI
jgi:hypothetical protein